MKTWSELTEKENMNTETLKILKVKMVQMLKKDFLKSMSKFNMLTKDIYIRDSYYTKNIFSTVSKVSKEFETITECEDINVDFDKLKILVISLSEQVNYISKLKQSMVLR